MTGHEYVRQPGDTQWTCRNPACDGWATTGATEQARQRQKTQHAAAKIRDHERPTT